MTEARAQTQRKETMIHDLQDSITSRLHLMEKTMAAQNEKLEKSFANMLEALRLIGSGASVETIQPSMSSDPAEIVSDLNQSTNQGNHFNYAGVTRLAQFDFPRFNGDKIRDWLFKIEQFFEIDHTPDELKVGLASIHLDDLAAKWHRSLVQSEAGLNVVHDWSAYKVLLQERFNDLLDDPIAELKQLQEIDGIEEYHGRFELLKARVNLPEEYLVSAYLAGLRSDTQIHVRLFHPQSIHQCLLVGRLYEMVHPPKQSPTVWSSSEIINNKETEHHMEEATMGDVQTQQHEDEDNEDAHISVDTAAELSDDAGRTIEEDSKPMPKISVNAISGVFDYNTMRVRGTYNKRNLFILIDSGFTHNLMDPKVAEKLGCVVKSAGSMKVSVEDGNKLGVQGMIDEFKWQFQYVEFETDLMLIPLGGCDMVLGIQLLKTLGPMTWNFEKLEMGFKMGKQKLLLHGMKPGSVREVKAQKLNILHEEQAQISMICVQQIPTDDGMQAYYLDCNSQVNTVSSEVDQLLGQFQESFEEPNDLPPFRENHDHKIPIIGGEDPLNQRPYRYYRRFVKNYGTIASPLHALTKKEGFIWSPQAQEAFDELKQVLSRVEGSEVLHRAMAVVECDLLKEIQAGYETYAAVKAIITELKQNSKAKKHYSGVQNVLRRKSKIVVPQITQLRDTILQWLHCSGNNGHSGRDATLLQETLLKEPEKVLDRIMVNRQGKAATKVLVKGTNGPEEEATWEFLLDLQKRFPAFEPCGQGS